VSTPFSKLACTRSGSTGRATTRGGVHGVVDAVLPLLGLDHNAVMERAEGHDAAPLMGAVLGRQGGAASP
jgi:hypothetical protein